MKKSLSIAFTFGLVACTNGTTGSPDASTNTNAITADAGDDAAPQNNAGGDATPDAPDAHTPPGGEARDAATSTTQDASAPTQADAAGGPSTVDAGGGSPAPSGKVPALIAMGKCVRRVLSCDGGHTWIHDTQIASCGESEWYNDHASHAASATHGIDYGDGYFVAAWGWGYNGPVLRSKDGINWQDTPISNAAWFGGVAYGNDRFLVGGLTGYSMGRVSTDGGATWSTVTPQAGFQSGALRTRGIGFVDGHFIMMDDADLWTTATGNGDFAHVQGNGCSPRNFVAGNGVVLASNENTICRSTDHLGSFQQLSSVPGGTYDTLTFAEGQFHVWTNGNRYSSSDGTSWTATPLTGGFRGDRQQTAAIAYSAATKTYAAIDSDWSSHAQSAWVSQNGVDWTQVNITRGPGIRTIGVGYVEPSADCKAP